ncbi:MAG TPA: TetR/AcrR family transcriptional regulator [Thermoanaerobaculia bacterium]
MVQIRAVTQDPTAKVSEKKLEILRAASRVFRDKGLHSTGMRDIAAEMGMAVGNLYYYFEDKEELLAFIQETTLASLLELAARVQAVELRADQKLYLLIVGHVVLLNEGTPGSLAHLEVEALGKKWRRAVQARRDEYERSFRKLVEDGIAAGIFRRLDSKVGALAILGSANWTVKWFRPDGGKSAREIGCETAEILVRGLLSSGSAWQPPPPDLIATVTEPEPRP